MLNKKRKYYNTIFLGLSYLLALFPFVPYNIVSVLLILWSIGGLLNALNNGRKFFDIKMLLLLVSPFLLAVYGYIFLDDSELSLKAIERSLPFLIVPIFINLNRDLLSKQFVFKWMIVFGAIVFFLVAKGHIQTIQAVFDYAEGSQWENDIWGLFNQPSFHHHYRVWFADHSGIHPTYSGLFIALIMVFSNHYYFTAWSNFSLSKKSGVVFHNILALALLSMVTARMPLIALMVVFSIQFASKIGWYRALIYVPGLLIGLSGVMYFTVPSFKQKVNEINLTSTENATKTNNNSYNIRFGILDCSVAVVNDDWLFGAGVGGAQYKLNDCYEGLSFETFRKEKFNSHNQYIDYLMSYGVLGITCLLSIFIFSIIRCYKSGMKLGVLVLTIFLLVMLTENTLSRLYGILPAVFLISLFNFAQPKLRIE